MKKKTWDLIDGLTDSVVPENPREFADQLCKLLAKRLDAHRVALFGRLQESICLLASRSVEQPVIDAATYVWHAKQAALEGGQRFVARADDEKLPSVVADALRDARELVVLPVRSKDRLEGVLYLDTMRPLDEEHLAAASQAARLAAIALRSAVPSESAVAAQPAADTLGSYLERTPEKEIVRDQMLRLLNAHEWNIARVSRLLGVTRRTIYQRLARFKIRRLKVSKNLRPARRPTS